MPDVKNSYLKEHMTFGAVIIPHHPHNGNPAWQLRKDIKLAQDLEQFGFDEVWVGEHHANGSEIICDPALMLAAIGERTEKIKLGTGVVSMSYHHPYVVANRMAQLDNMTRGRVMMGTGPGKLPIDAHMMGIDTTVQRRRQTEAVDACVRLLRGEVVNMETDWFVLRDAQLQLVPYNGPGEMEILAAAMYSPAGPMLAGKFGISLFSLAAGTPEGFAVIDKNWQVYEETCQANGHVARRDKWRLMGPMFLGNSRAEVDRAVAQRMPYHVEYVSETVKLFNPGDTDWMTSPQKTVDRWRSDEGIPIFGKGVFGTPDEAIAEIERLWGKTGGFGGYNILVFDFADYAATYRSFELFAEVVIPHFRAYRNRSRVRSLHYVQERAEMLFKPMAKDTMAANQEYAESRGDAALPAAPNLLGKAV